MFNKIPNYIREQIFIIIFIIASTLLYIQNLGFSSDDWPFLAIFANSDNQALSGLIKAYFRPDLAMRPVQVVYYALLYKFFGINPTLYHLTNTIVVIFIALLIFSILKTLKLPKAVSIAVPLIYSVLPNYSSGRMWYASFQANLSLLFYMLSFYSGTRYFLSFRKRPFWFMVTIMSLILSGLSYEVVLPLFFVNSWIYLNAGVLKNKAKLILNRTQIIIFVTTIIFSVISVFIFKKVLTTRFETDIFSSPIAYFRFAAYVIYSALYINFGVYGILLPWKFANLILKQFDLIRFVHSAALGLIFFSYIYNSLKENLNRLLTKKLAFKLITYGLIFFFSGYSIFLLTSNIGFTATGIGNRVAIASSLGYTLLITGLCCLVAILFKSKNTIRLIFSILISTFMLVFIYISNTVAFYWGNAWVKEKTVLSEIKTNIPRFSEHSTLILDGICPYDGPGIVFESGWDLKGALSLMYKETSLKADVVTPRMSVNDSGIKTKIYGQNYKYPFKDLYVFDFKRKSLTGLPDAKAAREYFKTYNPDMDNDCPKGAEGNGVSIF